MSRRWYAALALALATLSLITAECYGNAVPVKSGLDRRMLGPSGGTSLSAATITSSAGSATATPRVARSGLRLRPRTRAELQAALSRLDAVIGDFPPPSTNRPSAPSTRPTTPYSPLRPRRKGVVHSIACSVKQKLKAMLTLKCAQSDHEISRSEELN
ncbi:hypothetical protein BCV69DRAFT_766 [Microstroma glucosiphilum]|uniref:Uncharacterized protein n=1 Tax=Pseudomicrostroma glucosiphilum TaxID=1684307 RepID=A0A316UF15_9BASI|nr:hypothetical protein BCV69DRAFT_766 [Pseudomicrostroma glucosiphilum]PWN23504.1 hypothetical protein BCV69DRAFT_766 [Pseudomicrostroma glucosiphilum]